MKKKYITVCLALLLGLLTVYFCLYLADGVFGMQGLKSTEFLGDSIWYGPVFEKSVDRDNQTGAVIFWVFAIGLPLLFSRWISWRDTLVNYWLYPVCWWVVDDLVGSHPGHAFLNPGVDQSSMIFPNFGLSLFPFVLTWTLLIFLIHTAVFVCFKNFWNKDGRVKNT